MINELCQKISPRAVAESDLFVDFFFFFEPANVNAPNVMKIKPNEYP
jgi:hypothetical protein